MDQNFEFKSLFFPYPVQWTVTDCPFLHWGPLPSAMISLLYVSGTDVMVDNKKGKTLYSVYWQADGGPNPIGIQSGRGEEKHIFNIKMAGRSFLMF